MNGRSRYDNWKLFKNSSDFSQFKRSDSRPEYWRSDSRYVREPSRSRSRPQFESRDRFQNRQSSRSQSRSDSKVNSARPSKLYEEVETIKNGQVALEKKTDKIVKTNLEMMKILDKLEKKSNNVRIVETVEQEEEIEVLSDVMNILYTKDVKETDVMIVDTGCPKSLTGESWLEN